MSLLDPIPLNIGARYLRLNGNKLEGRLPPSLANCTRLQVLDLGKNMIHDTFPEWLQNLPELKVIILKSNSFYGHISLPLLSEDAFTRLHIIDLSHNNFSGHMRENLFTNLEALKNLDAGDEAMPGHLKRFIHFPNYPYMQYFNFYLSMSLTVKGQELEISKILESFTTIDLSSNNFSGHIPESIGNLSSLRLLNLSRNSISGNILLSLRHMLKLEQLDLSWNELAGGIPNALTNLTFLTFLNLSHNHLSGSITNGKQFSTFSNDSYIGNSRLCGSPLTRNCEPMSAVQSPSSDEDGSAVGFMSEFTWKEVVMGYGCGIVIGFIVGNFMLCLGKPKWFIRFVPIEIAIWLRKLKHKAQTFLHSA